MYRAINDFISDWKYESEATLLIFNNLTQESLNQSVTHEGRSLKKLAWHIIQSNPEMLVHAGSPLENFDEKESAPEKISDLIKHYEKKTALVEKFVSENWKDENMLDELNIYGGVWKKGKLLSSMINHQAHHRAQMTVLMRQAGLKVPGVYGPSKEEWEAYGMPPQD